MSDLVKELNEAIDKMSNYRHNSQDWDDETYRYINPVFEKIKELEKRLENYEKIIDLQKVVIKELTDVAEVHLDDMFEKIKKVEELMRKDQP